MLLGPDGICRAEEAVNPAELEGQSIVSIVFVRRNIFDTTKPESDSWPYKAANALNIVTRERFIRSMILFTEGDEFSQSIAEESERILRSLDFLNPVYITARSVEGGVEVTVDTHDQWTLEVGGEFGLQGDRTDFGVVFSEENFLGLGRKVEVEYRSEEVRTTWNYAYEDPNIFGTRLRGKLRHQDSSDGYADEVQIAYPFYALGTKKAGGCEWTRTKQIDHLYANGDRAVSGRHNLDRWKLWGGVRLPGPEHRVDRLIFGYQRESERFGDWEVERTGESVPAPEAREIQGPFLRFQRITDRFEVLKGFRAWSAQEDVPLGPNFEIGVLLSPRGFGGDITRIPFDGSFRIRKRADRWLLLGDAWVSGRLDDGDARDVITGIQIAAAQLGHRGWQARLRYETGHELDRETQLTLGADTGLRGWDPDTFDGTSRAVANVQWRTLIKRDLLQLFSLGAVFFVDAGKTWGARVGPGTDGVRTNIGVGLLADLTSVSLSKLLRLEVAIPDDGGEYVVVVTGSALF